MSVVSISINNLSVSAMLWVFIKKTFPPYNQQLHSLLLIIIIINECCGSGDAAATASSLAITSFDIPLTDSMSTAGVTIGFMKG